MESLKLNWTDKWLLYSSSNGILATHVSSLIWYVWTSICEARNANDNNKMKISCRQIGDTGGSVYDFCSEGCVDSNPSIARIFHFVILTCFSSRLRPYKWNEARYTPTCNHTPFRQTTKLILLLSWALID